MDITRSGTQPSGKGADEGFTGAVRDDTLFQPPEPARALGWLEQRVDAHRAGEALGGSLPGGLGAASRDVHTASFLYSFFDASRRTLDSSKPFY